MIIPESFEILNRKIKVIVDHEGRMDGTLVGQANFDRCEIQLSPSLVRHGTPELVEAVFWHEVWHIMCNVLGQKELDEDERLADLFGGAIAQVLRSSRGAVESVGPSRATEASMPPDGQVTAWERARGRGLPPMIENAVKGRESNHEIGGDTLDKVSRGEPVRPPEGGTSPAE